MGSAGAMISDMNDIRRWIELYATGKTCGAGPTTISSTASPSWVTLPLVWESHPARLYATPARFLATILRTITRLRWALRSLCGLNYQAAEPVEALQASWSATSRRIITPDHVPFVYKREFRTFQTLIPDSGSIGCQPVRFGC